MLNRAVAAPPSHQPGAMDQVSYLNNLERNQPTIMSQMSSVVQPRMEVEIIFSTILEPVQ